MGWKGSHIVSVKRTPLNSTRYAALVSRVRSRVGLDDDLFTRVGIEYRGKTQKRSMLLRDVTDAMRIIVAQMGQLLHISLANGKREGCPIPFPIG